MAAAWSTHLSFVFPFLSYALSPTLSYIQSCFASHSFLSTLIFHLPPSPPLSLSLSLSFPVFSAESSEEGELCPPKRLRGLPESPPPQTQWPPCMRVVVREGFQYVTSEVMVVTADGAKIGRCAAGRWCAVSCVQIMTGWSHPGSICVGKSLGPMTSAWQTCK